MYNVSLSHSRITPPCIVSGWLPAFLRQIILLHNRCRRALLHAATHTGCDHVEPLADPLLGGIRGNRDEEKGGRGG